ncbi:MAG: FtsX-like permease family protein [Acidobacteriota bacterium]|nr:FtsX-like permease family protein [Acidobacteriota bacterium]
MIALRLGWRNLWRNVSRSLITISAIACGFALLIIIIGLVMGIANQMLNNGTSLLLGDVQIHHRNYLPERDLYETLGSGHADNLKELLDKLRHFPELPNLTPRVHAFGLLSSGEYSSGAQLMGVDAESEINVTSFLDGIEEGLIQPPEAQPVLLGDVLAKELSVTKGSKIAIVTQSADGSLGNDLFYVSGILHTGLAHIDRTLAVFTLSDLQKLLAFEPGTIHEIAISIQDPMIADQVVATLNQSALLPSNGIAHSWGDLAPQLKDYIGVVHGLYGFLILLIALFVAAGVLNTMMMSVFERTREIGLINALGMQPRLIISSILFESFFLGFLGLGLGLGLGTLGMSHLTTEGLNLTRWMGEFAMLGSRMDPILKAVWGWDYVVWSAVGLLTSTVLAALFPAMHATRLDPVEALAAPVEG